MPGQLFGYGRSDRSSKLIRGCESETPAGFRSRRGFGHDPAPVTPDNALFASYKTSRVHHATQWRGGGVAAPGQLLERSRSSVLPQAPEECRRHPPIKDHFRPEPEHESE